MTRRFLLLGLACALAAGPVLAQAPIWPTKPVKIIVAYPPGGSTDIAGRLLADRLTKTLGQQVVVENRGGAGGTIGAQSVVRADPDGYTLLLAASPEVSIAPITMKAMPYDPGEGPGTDHAGGRGAVLPRRQSGSPGEHARPN